MDSLVQTFHIDIGLMLAQLINFALVFAVLYFFALKPLMKIMSERTHTIEKGLEDAKSSAAALSSAQQEAQAILAKTRAEAQELFQRARLDADEKKNAIISQAKAEVAQVVTQGKNQLAQEKLVMLEQAKAEVVNLVTLGIQKVLTEGADKEQVAKKISEKK